MRGKNIVDRCLHSGVGDLLRLRGHDVFHNLVEYGADRRLFVYSGRIKYKGRLVAGLVTDVASLSLCRKSLNDGKARSQRHLLVVRDCGQRGH